MSGWLKTNRDDLFFEDTSVGRLKKKIWEASEEEISKILDDYGIPSPSELGKPGAYIQNTIRQYVLENRKKNDILFLPVGCTELHGRHTVSGLDTFMVTQLLEGVRRYTAKQGSPVNLSFTPLNFGGHPHHHIGMPGTIHLEDDVMKRILIDVMVGFWNDGFRKIIIINNHGHQWLLEAAIQELQKTWNLPGIFRVIDWHRAVREFFRTKERGGDWDTNFVHADEAETSVMLLLAPEFVEMKLAQETTVEGYLPDGHFDKAVDPFSRPSKWSEGQGHFPIEMGSIPEGVVGKPTLSDAKKAKRTIAAILSYLTLVHDEIRKAFPPGKLPPIEETTMRTEEEMKPYLKEPFTKGWRPIYAIRKMGL
jgi:creatinine amidohydrolase/Fe(II)-dependent formamide hydrolase-like protein